MGLFGRRSRTDEQEPAAPGDDRRRVDLVLPAGSTVTSRDLDALLGSWSGGADRVDGRHLLPAGLRWTGPRAGDPARREQAGTWIYEMSWSRPTSSAGPDLSASDPRFIDDWQAALEVAGWLYDAARGGDDPSDGGPRAYATAAVNGLARRTGGTVRLPGGDAAPPPDPEATWSVYVTDEPSPEAVAVALAPAIPGLFRDALDLQTWVLSSPDGRGAWWEDLELDGAESWDEFGGPASVPPCALLTLGSASLHAIRIEGAEDTADEAARRGLDEAARTCAATLGGLAVDAEGFPV